MNKRNERWFKLESLPLGIITMSFTSLFFIYRYVVSEDGRNLILYRKGEDVRGNVVYSKTDGKKFCLETKHNARDIREQLSDKSQVVEGLAMNFLCRIEGVTASKAITYEGPSSVYLSILRIQFDSEDTTKQFIPPDFYGEEIGNHSEWCELALWKKLTGN